jgi:hypothetical protein
LGLGQGRGDCADGLARAVHRPRLLWHLPVPIS